jgi:hypothetical protein
MPEYIDRLGDIAETRRIFLEPAVAANDRLAKGTPDLAAIKAFLCHERRFAPDRVEAALARAFSRPTLF